MPKLAISIVSLAAVLLLPGCSDDGTPTTPATAPMGEPQPETASYELTFDAAWSAATHPIDAPSSPHFTTLVGGTHDARVAFWNEGAVATAGIEAMAERGRTTPLDDEVRRAIAAGTAEHLLLGTDSTPSPGRSTLLFEVSRRAPRVTLVSMIGPSPDWFVGVSGLELFVDGAWVESVVVSLPAWDAGTDDGESFRSPDADAVPPGVVSRIVTAPLAPGGVAAPMGSFTFRRVG